MGKITATIKVINGMDEFWAREGRLHPSLIRSIETEAIANDDVIMSRLKKSVIKQLGLPFLTERKVGTPNGVVRRKIYAEAHLFLMDRGVSVDVVEVPDDCANLIGPIPLEELDFVPDLRRQQIIPNPEHGGEWQDEEY